VNVVQEFHGRQYFVRTGDLLHRLEMQEWEVGTQYHGRVGASQTKIGKQGTEPPIRGDNAFIKAKITPHEKIGWSP